jgi:uncharacterized protein YdhG (YjbR/CyaY superfamily)
VGGVDPLNPPPSIEAAGHEEVEAVIRVAKVPRLMTERKRRTKGAKKPVRGFSAEERAAMRERVRELRASATKEEQEREVLEKIAEMQTSDRVMAERVHAIVKATAPALSPKTWYGMPAYFREGNVICYFRPAEKFKTRYATLGFSDEANLDDGHMWPTDFALTQLTAAEEEKIASLVKRAVG